MIIAIDAAHITLFILHCSPLQYTNFTAQTSLLVGRRKLHCIHCTAKTDMHKPHCTAQNAMYSSHCLHCTVHYCSVQTLLHKLHCTNCAAQTALLMLYYTNIVLFTIYTSAIIYTLIQCS